MDLALAGQLVPIRPISQLNVKGWWGEVAGGRGGRTTEILKTFYHGSKQCNARQTELGAQEAVLKFAG